MTGLSKETSKCVTRGRGRGRKRHFSFGGGGWVTLGWGARGLSWRRGKKSKHACAKSLRYLRRANRFPPWQLTADRSSVALLPSIFNLPLPHGRHALHALIIILDLVCCAQAPAGKDGHWALGRPQSEILCTKHLARFALLHCCRGLVVLVDFPLRGCYFEVVLAPTLSYRKRADQRLP